MSAFNQADYFPILTAAIRQGAILPFDCYILLQTNNRIVRYVKRGEAFPEDKLEKLHSHQVKRLHIHRRDIQYYEAFVEHFLKTPEGQALVANLAAQDPIPPVEGMPDSLQVLFDDLLAKAKQPITVAPEIHELLTEIGAEVSRGQSLEQVEDPVAVAHAIAQRLTEALQQIKTAPETRVERAAVCAAHVEKMMRHVRLMQDASEAAQKRKDGEAPLQLVRISNRAMQAIDAELQDLRALYGANPKAA